MVGLVVVSHSRALAVAAVALARQMAPGGGGDGGSVAIEVAAGLDETTTGTDAVAITEAIAAADSGDGVVVLMDLGSAVLSASLALELLDDDIRERVTLCPAPLVEGLIAAAVTAASGADRHDVADEAAAGLAGKQAHLQATPSSSGTSAAPADVVTVINDHGLHARPAASLVTAVRAFDASVELRNRTTGSGWVAASSLTRVATLGAVRGHEIEVRASGPAAREAIDGVVALIASGFGSPADGGSTGERAAGVQAASPGIGMGLAVRVSGAAPDIPDEPSRGGRRERKRLDGALAAVRDQLRRQRNDVFAAHLVLLDDAELLADVRARMDNGAAAPRAWAQATARIAAEFDALADPYLRDRAADVRAIGDQVLRTLLGVPAAAVEGSGVLVATDLTPAQAATLDRARIAGVVLSAGSPTSHAAILLRGLGIPAVVGTGLSVPAGTMVALDGSTGEVVVAPPEDVLQSFRSRAAEQKQRHNKALSRTSAAAVTRDGRPVPVGANIGSVADARAAAAHGADLAGLVRTEFLFLSRATAPDLDEQVAVYRAIADALGGRRITLRTLDVGGDKPLPYAPAPVEANPFLGVRGIRHSLANRSLFTTQLRAIVEVARSTPVNVMFPMITTVPELVEARRLLGDTPPGTNVGMMMEVPAAALKAADFAPYVDFFSIGTNDLTQYALAAERGNLALAALTDGLDPGVLRLIEAICEGAGDAVTVAVCGELAADERVIPLLLRCGVDELSVAPPLIPRVKETVRAATAE